MRFNSTADSPIRIVPPGIYILSGVVDIRKDSGQLRIRAGVFENRQEMRLSKAASRMTRLVVLGHSGTITFSALRWLADIGAGMIQIDYDASVVVSSIRSGRDNPKLRRAQARAMGDPIGLEIARELIARKIAGQAAVSRTLGNESTAEKITRIGDTLQQIRTTRKILPSEAQAASVYWKAWSKVPVLFARKDRKRIPDEWRLFGGRFSPLTSDPRKAGNPANAILNYLYALLEAETRIGILTMGMDPGIGILHKDQPGRDSFACDLMEVVRPEVDAWLLQLLTNRRFAASDFFETPRGQIMLTKPLAHELATTLPLWAKAVAPIIEEVASRLVSGPVPTRLTQSRRSRKDSDFAHSPLRKAVSQAKSLTQSCRECGKPTQSSKKFCSPGCFDLFNEEVLLPRFTRSGPAALSRLRSKNIDPAHGGEAARKRGKSNSHRAAQRAEWKKLRQSLRIEIKTLLHTIGATALLVTHDQVDAMAIGDRIAVMREGKIEQVGTAEEIYSLPDTTFVARFIGSPPMNLLPGIVESGQVLSEMISPFQVPSIPDGPILIGIRPEHLRPAVGAALTIQGRILATELSGGEWVLHLQVSDSTLAARCQLNERPRLGETIGLHTTKENLILFRPLDGKRIDDS